MADPSTDRPTDPQAIALGANDEEEPAPQQEPTWQQANRIDEQSPLSDKEPVDEDWTQLSSSVLVERVTSFKNAAPKRKLSGTAADRGGLVAGVLEGGWDGKDKSHDEGHKKKGALLGVFVPTCENMWGVLIFLRFYWIVGHAGVAQALLAVFLSFLAAFCTVSSMSAIISSGGHVSEGGPYYMISRAMGPVVGATVGIMYWLAVTMLSVLECLGAVEGILMAAPDAEFPGCTQVYGSVLMLMLALMVYGGITFVTRLGVVFCAVVFFTLTIYYVGIIIAPSTPEAEASPCVTGMSWDTLQDNLPSHFGDGVSFGVTLSVFYPCFTGILSGANRADVLRDPPKNIREGTFAAIIFSLFMYSSFMIMWGSVANYKYLQGKEDECAAGDGTSRRLAGGADGAYLVETIVWNPFPHAAHFGIIFSSLSQALQCLIVAPRLLQSVAKDKILAVLNLVAPLSRQGEPARALLASYIIAALLVLIGNLNMVAPLLTMCFLVAYAFMNISCFTLTWLRSPAWRPTGIHRKRYRVWYLGTGFFGFLVCLGIMFTVDQIWASASIVIVICLYLYINWKLEAREWGSAMDGIRFQLALKSLIGLEGSQQSHVNWRPQVLILYRVKVAEELQGIVHHEILRFYANLRKADGFCVVGCVLESPESDETALQKAAVEKELIQAIMTQENLQGFAEVAVAPSWEEGSKYIIQLAGIGGLVPNTVLLDWPEEWQHNPRKAHEFVHIVTTALAKDKAVLAVKGLSSMPTEIVYGTIDIWWMIHDGGFMILLSWLLVSHRIWRNCKLRVFTITETVDAERAKLAATALTKTLRQRRLAEVNVEVILADPELITPFTYDWTIRADERAMYMEKLQAGNNRAAVARREAAIPQAIDELFKLEPDPSSGTRTEEEVEDARRVQVTDARRESADEGGRVNFLERINEKASDVPMKNDSVSDIMGSHVTRARTESKAGEELHAKTADQMRISAESLNKIMVSRSKRAQLVIINLPDLWGTSEEDVNGYMAYTTALTSTFDRALFVHSSGAEVFDIRN